MARRTFASQKELQDYAGQTGKVCRLEGVAKRQRLLSPDQYDIVDVRTFRGVRRVILFPKAISKRSSTPMSGGSCYQAVDQGLPVWGRARGMSGSSCQSCPLSQ